MLSKSLIYLSAEGWAVLPLLVVWPEATQSWTLQALWWGYWQPPRGLIQTWISQHCCCQCPCHHGRPSWPAPPQETLKHSQAGLAQSSMGSLLLSPGYWYGQGFVCALQQSLVSSSSVEVHRPQDWKRSVSFLIPKKGNAKECSNHHIISHASKVMLKSFKLGFSSKWTSRCRNWI